MIGRGGLLACLLFGLPAAAPSRQEPASAAQEDELGKLLQAAIGGKPYVRPQAAGRIVGLWSRADEAGREAIVARLLAEAGEGTRGLAALGSALTESLGGIDDPRLRTRLWAAVDDADYPWRPYAARGLALDAREDELACYRRLLADPIAPVRGAAIGALDTLDARGDEPAIRARLADEVDLVRRAAADLLVRWDHDDALWYLVEELRRDDRFFDRPTGQEARYRTERLLRAHLGDLAGYDASRAPADNAAALAALAVRVEQRAGARPQLPPVACATALRDRGEVIGLELRSCRRGEYFLRWTRDDRLLVGQGTPAVVELPAGTTARLLEAGARRTAEVSGVSFGAPGCDLELLHWRPEDETRTWVVSKGPEAVEDLRPAALDAFYAVLAASLPDAAHADARLDRLRSRALEAVAAIGGAIE